MVDVLPTQDFQVEPEGKRLYGVPITKYGYCRKKPGRKSIHQGKDYTEEYKAKTRCPKCRKQTKPDDYLSRTGKVKKTCATCREYTLKIVNKTKKTPKRDKYDAFKKMLKKMKKEDVMKACKDDEDLLSFVKFIFE